MINVTLMRDAKDMTEREIIDTVAKVKELGGRVIRFGDRIQVTGFNILSSRIEKVKELGFGVVPDWDTK